MSCFWRCQKATEILSHSGSRDHCSRAPRPLVAVPPCRHRAPSTLNAVPRRRPGCPGCRQPDWWALNWTKSAYGSRGPLKRACSASTTCRLTTRPGAKPANTSPLLQPPGSFTRNVRGMLCGYTAMPVRYSLRPLAGGRGRQARPGCCARPSGQKGSIPARATGRSRGGHSRRTGRPLDRAVVEAQRVGRSAITRAVIQSSIHGGCGPWMFALRGRILLSQKPPCPGWIGWQRASPLLDARQLQHRRGRQARPPLKLQR